VALVPSTAMETILELSPAAALRQATDAGLVVRRENPLNGEAPLAALEAGAAMPTGRF